MENPFSEVRTVFRERGALPDRRKQLSLERLWMRRAVTDQALRARGIAIDQDTREKYERWLEKKKGGKSLQALWAELMLLEGTDETGYTMPKAKAYHWLGPDVTSYPPHPIDDAFQKTDAILMFADPEDPDVAHPLSVDVSIDPTQYYTKFVKDFFRLTALKPVSVYWADTLADHPGELVRRPTEGQVPTLNVSVYIPSEYVSRYMDENQTAEHADKLMRKLGPFVAYQVQKELEAIALAVIKRFSWHEFAVGSARDSGLTRQELLNALKTRISDDPLVKILRGCLPSVWEAADNFGAMDEKLEKRLPDMLKNFPSVARKRKAAAANRE